MNDAHEFLFGAVVHDNFSSRLTELARVTIRKVTFTNEKSGNVTAALTLTSRKHNASYTIDHILTVGVSRLLFLWIHLFRDSHIRPTLTTEDSRLLWTPNGLPGICDRIIQKKVRVMMVYIEISRSLNFFFNFLILFLFLFIP